MGGGAGGATAARRALRMGDPFSGRGEAGRERRRSWSGRQVEAWWRRPGPNRWAIRPRERPVRASSVDLFRPLARCWGLKLGIGVVDDRPEGAKSSRLERGLYCGGFGLLPKLHGCDFRYDTAMTTAAKNHLEPTLGGYHS